MADFSLQRHTHLSFDSPDLLLVWHQKKKKKKRIGCLRYFSYSKPGSLSVSAKSLSLPAMKGNMEGATNLALGQWESFK